MKKTQNQLLIELYVKHRMYKELREFKRSLKLPKADRMTTKEKWTIINELVNNTTT